MTKPTIEEMKAQSQKIGLIDSECESMWHHYESKRDGKTGQWMIGKRPMTSWQSAMINWRKGWEAKGRPGLNVEGAETTLEPKTVNEARWIIQELQQKIDAILLNYSPDVWNHRQVTEESDRHELKRLRDKRDALKRRMGI